MNLPTTHFQQCFQVFCSTDSPWSSMDAMLTSVFPFQYSLQQKTKKLLLIKFAECTGSPRCDVMLLNLARNLLSWQQWSCDGALLLEFNVQCHTAWIAIVCFTVNGENTKNYNIDPARKWALQGADSKTDRTKSVLLNYGQMTQK